VTGGGLAAADESLIEVYIATRWRVRTPTGTLLVRIGQPTPIVNGAIVTAYNPASRLLPRSSNRGANRRLLARLRRLAAEVCPAAALGHGPEAALWREPGLGVRGPSLDTLVRLGGDFGQNALVWTDAEGIARLVVCRAGFAGRRPGAVLA
jgi:hypothetical protein